MLHFIDTKMLLIVLYTINVMEVFNREDKQCIGAVITVYIRHI